MNDTPEIVPGVSIWRRSGVGARARYQVTYRNPITGRRRTESVSPDRGETVDYARQLRSNLGLGRTRRKPLALPVVTYFIRAGAGPIKIGRAYNLPRRLKTIQCGSPEPLTLLGYVDGDREAEIHARFAAFRLRGEWFAPVPKLLAFIAAKAIPMEGL